LSAGLAELVCSSLNTQQLVIIVVSS